MQKANLDAPAPSPTASAAPAEAPPRANLPVPVPPRPIPAPRRPKRHFTRPALALIALAAAIIGGVYWWTHLPPELPPGFAWGNGRIEADEIDISTKFAGRVAEILADEGDMVKAGQVVARMDVRDLEATLGRDQATIQQAQKTLDSAQADLEQQRSQVKLADQELQRTRALVQRGNASVEALDQRQAAMDGATAAYNSILGRIGQAEHAVEAAKQDAALTQINIADNTLVAPKDGRIEYRISNLGEVLPAGGKVFTMLDIESVYMDIFLPTAQAGRTVLGTEGRIVLDALPDRPIPAMVSFVSAQAQFTPKAVETQSERDKLMFRVRVRIDPERLRAHAAQVRSGLPGVAYVRLDRNAEWPPQLQPKSGP
jgi:HlyD family secretion protein